MTISLSHDHVEPFSVRDADAKDRDRLKQEIKGFLSAASRLSCADDVCPRCGKHMQYIEMIVSIYGDGTAWPIRLPLCGCFGGE